MSFEKENYRLNENQFNYLSSSLGMSISGAAVPNNLFMPSCFSQMKLIERASSTYGSIVNLLCKELDWSQDHLNAVLSPEQQDSVALAILSYKDGEGFLLADMAGFGKGRIVASLAYYMKLQGILPIISTLNAELFSNLAIDFRDIGVLEKMGTPFVLNNGVSIEDVRLSNTPLIYPKIKKKDHKETISNGWRDLTDKYGFVLTTYSQLTKEDSDKTRFMMGLVKENRAALINDEAHSISRFLAASSKIYYALGSMSVFRMESTATAGRTATDLRSYNKTYPWLSTIPFASYEAMSERALNELASLSTIRAVALGKMIRRENDRTGIEFTYVMPDAETGRTIDVLDIYGVKLFQAMKKLSILNWRASQKLNAERQDEKSPLWSGPDFFGMAGRMSRQLTACMIARAVGMIAVDQINEGRKPFIAMDVTLSSLLEKEDRDEDIKPEDVDFALLSKEALETLCRLENSKKPPVSIRDKDIFGSDFVSLVESSVREIEGIIDNMPDIIPSPLDTIKEIVSSARRPDGKGTWAITEISGRSHARLGGNGVFAPISESRNARTAKFNNGDYHAVVCTRAMSTGQSFHAAAFFKDQSQRVFIEGVPPDNPLQRTQMHGRVQRRGEVCKPIYLGVKTGLSYHEGRLRRLSEKDERMNMSVRGEKGGGIFISHIERFAVQAVLSRHPRLMALMGLNTRFHEEDGSLIDALYRRSFMILPQDREMLFSEIEAEKEKRKAVLEEVLVIEDNNDAGDGWTLVKEKVIEGSRKEGTAVILSCLERKARHQTAALMEGWDISSCKRAVADLKDRKIRETWLTTYLPKWAKSVSHALKTYKNKVMPYAVSENLVGKWNARCDDIVRFLENLKTGTPLLAPNQYGVVSSAYLSHVIPPEKNFFKWDEWKIYYASPAFDKLLFITIEQILSESFTKNPFIFIGRSNKSYVHAQFNLADKGIERIFILGGNNPAGVVSWADDLGDYCWNAVNYQREGEPNERYGIFLSPLVPYELGSLERRLYTNSEIIEAINKGIHVYVSRENGICTIFNQNNAVRINIHAKGVNKRKWISIKKEIASLYGFNDGLSSFAFKENYDGALNILRNHFEFFISSNDYKRLNDD